MSNRVYPEVVEIYENEKHLVYLYEIYRNGEKNYYLSIGLKGDFRQKIESKTFPGDYSKEYIKSWLKSKIGAFRKCEGDHNKYPEVKQRYRLELVEE